MINNNFIQHTMTFNTNIKDISKFIGIEEIILENMSIKEINYLVEKQNNEITRNRINSETIERYKKFFKSWDLFISIFGEEIIPYMVREVNFNEITEEKWFKDECPYKNAEFLREDMGYYIPPRCRKQVLTKGKVYLISDSFQGLLHSKIISAYLKDKKPHLFDELNISIYELKDKNTDVYISAKSDIKDNKSIYVPIKALINKDINSIIERHIDYFATFNNGCRLPTMEMKENELKILENMEAFKILKKLIS